MEYELIRTIVICVFSAFVFGLVARKLKLPTIFGYLLAGVAIGPYTPGIVADVSIAKQLAEIGVILLMFGVGMHFSFKDLLTVRKVALPGAIFQIAAATALGAVVVRFAGFSWSDALVFGLTLSVASTVVLLRALDQGGITKTETGKIAIGWLIVEDVVMIFAIVLVPFIADMLAHRQEIDSTLIVNEAWKIVAKIAAFTALMFVAGRRILPWILNYVGRTKSRELLSLTMLTVALSFAYVAYTVFGTSFALGAFLAGLVLNESKTGHQSVKYALPMRDTFAVLFFVSVGMLFNPATLVQKPMLVLVALGIIIVGKFLAALLIMGLFRQNMRASLTIGVSLAQIGEFSFIFAGLAMTKGLLAEELYHVILAGALISIALNDFLFKALGSMKLLPAAVSRRA
ncbi:MAG: cation:proton antiporter [Alphaproteobacteria bacterium]|nr:cation:proton antiporter [Alphaproteobacteria bacterium]